MEFRIDFFPVAGEGACVRVCYGEPGARRVLVYDGGDTATADLLVRQLQAEGEPARIDHLVSSHPSPGHIEGLHVLLQRVPVGELWMHTPWVHEAGLSPDAQPAPLARGRALAAAAARLRVPVLEPFEGAEIGPFHVLSPDRHWYLGALARSLQSPPRDELSAAASLRRLLRFCAMRLGSLSPEALPSRPPFEGLGATSVVLYGEFGGKGLLLTGNAGNTALHRACDAAERSGLQLPKRLGLVQMPDQGREDHLSSALLDRLIGAPSASGQRAKARRTAVAFVDETAPPSRTALVANALARRGFSLLKTRGSQLSEGDYLATTRTISRHLLE